MASRKEEEKHEKIIRGLTKLPENRKCINCGSLGPQYVCTNFSIFVCITCSGLHREFTHRVKSISMAHFNSAEVGALQAGGNQRARDIYLKEWDSSRHSLPDSSNPDKLREFIKSVYVERRFSGERQRARWSDTDEGSDIRKPKYAQSPTYEDRHDDRRNNNNRPASRGSDRGFDGKMSPARFENDRDRDRRYDDRRYPDDRERRYEERDRGFEDRRADDRDRDRGRDDRDRRNDDRDRRFETEDRDRRVEEPRVTRRTSDDWDARRRPPNYRGGETPPLRSVRDILGEDVPKLRVEDSTRATNGRVEDAESPRSVSSQGDTRLRGLNSSKSLDSAVTTNGPSTFQTSISASLIDFAAEPEATKASTASDPFAQPKVSSNFDPFGTSQPQPQQPNPSTSFDPFAASQQPSTASTSFDPFAASKTNAPVDPFSTSGGASTTGWASFDVSPPKAPVPAPLSSLYHHPPNPVLQHNPNGTLPPQHSGGWSSGMSAPIPASAAPPSFQEWFQPQQGQPQQTGQSQQPLPFQPVQSLPAQQHAVENGSVQQGRREIPENLFAMPPVAPYGMGGVQMHMPHSFGYAQPPPFAPQMQGPMPPYGQPPSTKSNPFDLPGDSLPGPSPTFPNMSAMQHALPSYNAGPGPQSSPAPALGGPPPQWSQSGFGSTTHAPPASYPPFSGAGFNQQPPVPAHLMQGSFGRPGGPGGFTNMNMNGPASYGGSQAQPPMQSAAGNPFG